jgi:Transglycosylase-like domain
MRNIAQLAFLLALLATQVNVPQVNFGNVAAAAGTSVTPASVYEVKLDTTNGSPVQVSAPAPFNYNAQVLAPLKADQAAEAAVAKATAIAAARARRLRFAKAASVAAVIVPGSDVWADLRYCEAGGNYARNSGNGYYGAYQYTLSTWDDFMGYARPDLAPPAVQDAKAHATEAARGWRPWPACSRKLGLL